MNWLTRTFQSTLLLGFAAGLALAACACREAPVQATETTRDALAMQDFDRRVENYIQIHRQIETKYKLRHIKATKIGGDIIKRQHLLAERIQAARSSSKEGEIFTPEISAYFTRSIDAAYLANSEGILSSLACVPRPVNLRIKANGIYPEGSDYNIMPPTILLHLPRLPEEQEYRLEYRIVGTDLIIRDVEANLVVDVMRNAIKSLPEGAKCDD